MKNYATETDIITTPDALYAPGAKVLYQDRVYTVRDFMWNTLQKTWTYCLTHSYRDVFGREMTDRLAYEEAPERLIQPKD